MPDAFHENLLSLILTVTLRGQHSTSHSTYASTDCRGQAGGSQTGVGVKVMWRLAESLPGVSLFSRSGVGTQDFHFNKFHGEIVAADPGPHLRTTGFSNY